MDRFTPLEPDAPDIIAALRSDLLAGLARSPKVISRAARSIAGHELDDCPLDHPLVGRLHCGDWLLFAEVHLMHLEQLERLAEEGRR